MNQWVYNYIVGLHNLFYQNAVTAESVTRILKMFHQYHLQLFLQYTTPNLKQITRMTASSKLRSNSRHSCFCDSKTTIVTNHIHSHIISWFQNVNIFVKYWVVKKYIPNLLYFNSNITEYLMQLPEIWNNNNNKLIAYIFLYHHK